MKIKFVRTARLWQSWQAAYSGWRYEASLFRLAMRNQRFPLPLMPLLAHMTFRRGIVPSVGEVCSVVSPLVSCDPLPRVYQCHAAWLREMHVGFFLSCFGEVWKDVRADLREGADWTFAARDGRELRIGIQHEGRSSARHYDKRKKRKQAEDCVMIRAAKKGGGLHLCSLEDLEAVVSTSDLPQIRRPSFREGTVSTRLPSLP